MEKTLNLEWQTQGITPSLLSGEDAKMLYDSLPEQTRVGLRYEDSTQSVTGSTPFASACLNAEVQKYGARTPNLRDLSRPEIMNLVKGRFYTDSRNLIIRSPRDLDFPKNNSLLRQIYELAEQKEGTIKDGFMVEGFTFVQYNEDNIGYGLKIVPTDDFRVIQDERFLGHNGDAFSKVDELGIPLFDKNGKRTWWSRNKGLSRLFLGRYLYFDAGCSDLASSYDGGRVVLLK